MTSSLLNTYQRFPVQFSRSEGCWLYDNNDNRYLDAIAGLAVSTLGHQHPSLVKTLQHYSTHPLQICNLFTIPEQELLAQTLCQLTGMTHAYFCNSGAEANEAAIKIARLYACQISKNQPIILTMDNSFHGRTFGAASATNNLKVQAGLGPLLPGFKMCQYNNLAELQCYTNNPNVVAVMLESIQGDGGIHIPNTGYLKSLQDLCQQQGWLLIIDEVQTGCGRTGVFCAYQHEEIIPDVITLAKGLGGGYPIGACLAQGKAAKVFQPGNHGSTFGGNPLACQMALTVLATLQQDDLIEQANTKGQRILTQLKRTVGSLNCIADIRGRGLIIGIELKKPNTDLAQQLIDRGLLIHITQQNIIRLLPPLIIQDIEIDFIVNTLYQVLSEY